MNEYDYKILDLQNLYKEDPETILVPLLKARHDNNEKQRIPWTIWSTSARRFTLLDLK